MRVLHITAVFLVYRLTCSSSSPNSPFSPPSSPALTPSDSSPSSSLVSSDMTSNDMTAFRLLHGFERDTRYFMDGNITLGILFPSILMRISPMYVNYFQVMEAILFHIQKVNRNPKLLPNLTIGWALLDDRSDDQVAVLKCLEFVGEGCGKSPDTKPVMISGVIASSISSVSLATTSFMNSFGVPVLATFASTPLLDNKKRFPYFGRVVPNGNYVSIVMMDLLLTYNWTYVMLVNTAGPHGEDGAKDIQAKTTANDICIGSHVFVQNQEDVEKVADVLVKDKALTVVIMFINNATDGIRIVKAVGRKINSTRRIIYIFSDGTTEHTYKTNEVDIASSIFVSIDDDWNNIDFYAHYESISIDNTLNPWMKMFHESYYKCSIMNETCDTSWPIFKNHLYYRYSSVGVVFDLMNSLFFSMHDHITDNCPEVFGGGYEPNYIRKCLLSTVNEFMARITNEIAKVLHGYKINQFQISDENFVVYKTVGNWNFKTLTLEMRNDKIIWYDESYRGLTNDKRIVYWDNSTSVITETPVPHSICSYPCKARQYRIQQDLKCCWICRYCASNEVLSRNGTSCRVCDIFMWPDPLTATYCNRIPATYYTWTSQTTVIVLCSSLIGIVVCLTTLAYFHINKKARIMKATCVTLSIISLAGLSLTYTSTILIIAPPSLFTCLTGSIMMNIGISLTFGCLFLKTQRIYRIFYSDKTSANQLRFTKDHHLITLSFVITAIQIVLLTVLNIIDSPVVEFLMLRRHIYFVELICKTPTLTFLIPISYNIVLLLFSSVLALKTRKLPDNFNESKLIFLNTIAILFLLIAFTPTYISAEQTNQKSLLMAMLLLISSTLTLLCLHLPKVYASHFIDDIVTQTSSSVAPKSFTRNEPSKF